MCNFRSADASIKGYSFQFDATIKAILETPQQDQIIEIEGIEDFDIRKDAGLEAVQCKYYEGTDLTRPKFREIIEPMLADFKKRTIPINYHVYGFFKSVDELFLDKPTDFRSEVLCYYRIEEDSDKKKKRVYYNVATDLSLTDDEISQFLSQLKFTITAQYEVHKQSVKSILASLLSCSTAEVDAQYYPNAQSIVFEIACLSDSVKRKITKKYLLSKLKNNSNTIYSFLHLRTVGEADFCKEARRRYFTQTNISPDSRFFILDCTCPCNISGIKRVLHLIKDKWSSYSKKRKPDNERYTPFVYLRDIHEDTIVTIKQELFDEGVRFVDGYPFRNSKFAIQALILPQTGDNQLSLRFIYDMETLYEVFRVTSRRNIVYDFYYSKPVNQFGNIEINSIPITSIDMVTQII